MKKGCLYICHVNTTIIIAHTTTIKLTIKIIPLNYQLYSTITTLPNSFHDNAPST